MKYSRIIGTGSYLPEKVLTNQDLEKIMDTTDEWIRERTGIVKRHIAAGDETACDLAEIAASRAMEVAGKTPRQVDLIVLAGGSGRTLAFGPGHLGASALPGEIGNMVIAGHRDTHFAFLQEVRRGDRLGIESFGGATYVYEVTGLDVVDSRRGSLVLDTDVSALTLVTCYPFDALEPGGPLRYVVTARRRF